MCWISNQTDIDDRNWPAWNPNGQQFEITLYRISLCDRNAFAKVRLTTVRCKPYSKGNIACISRPTTDT